MQHKPFGLRVSKRAKASRCGPSTSSGRTGEPLRATQTVRAELVEACKPLDAPFDKLRLQLASIDLPGMSRHPYHRRTSELLAAAAVASVGPRDDHPRPRHL